ncbi:MAG: HTH domain-containing protein [Verrucomicrobia bacterium]|nr:HTH domain-containing protein [Verrucomicrobiota bacterium]
MTKLKDDERAAMSKVLEATAQGVTKAFSEETDPSESALLLSVVNKLEEVEEEKIAQKFATDNAFELAHLRGNIAKIELLEKAGPMLTAAEAAEALNISRQAVHKRIQSGSLFAMMYKGESRIPAWQIREGEVVPGIAKVLKNLDTTDWGKMLFLHSENMQLAGRKPMDVILKGDADSVAEVAALFGEQGAK